MRFYFHFGASQLTLLSLTLLCPLPWTVISYSHSHTTLLSMEAIRKLESVFMHHKDNWLVLSDRWSRSPKDSKLALLKPGEKEKRVTGKGDEVVWLLSPLPRGHSLEAMHYLERRQGEDREKMNEALTSIAGGLQAVSREKGGFGFRFGRKRWTDRKSTTQNKCK